MAQRILLVDDEPQLLELVTWRLEAQGYEVLAASDGDEALQRARAQHPDLIILDVMLPTLNGYEVCTLLKQDRRYRDIPVILLTAKTQQADERLGLECGADAYLRKPFQSERLLGTIRSLLGTPVAPRTRILIVDDEPDFLELVAQRLDSWGYEPLLAESGEEGWRLAQEQRPDLILLDIMMPKLKGRELCGLLKGHPNTRKIPVVFLTALGLPDQVKAGMELGAEDYLVKPLNPEELRRHLQVCLLRCGRADGGEAPHR